MRMVKAYWNWLRQSVNAHGIHSPFLFTFYTDVIGSKRKKFRSVKAEKLRLDMLQNKEFIPNIDLGAGSKKNNGSQLQISNIAKHVLKPKNQAELIGRIIQHLHPKSIIELGTSLGISTIYMAEAAPHAEIHTIEGNPHIRKFAVENFKNSGFVNIISHVGNFDDILPNILPNIKADIWFIDGNHTYEATKRYFEIAMNAKQDNLCIIFDDIYWSEGMQKAWNEIIQHPEITQSLDLFNLGIVFKKSALTKEHYYIR